MIDTLIVIAKEPVAGRVKTRLVPPLSFAQAAEVAAAALADTLAVASDFPCRQRVIALDGRPGDWLPEGWIVRPQVGGGLDARLSAAFAACDGGSALLVGMDTPQLSLEDLLMADLDRFDACLGGATDGGYWSIGLREPRRGPEVIAGVPMSVDRTGALQRARLVAAGMKVQSLTTLTDVDTFDVACEVAAAAPQTLFAAVVDRVVPVGARR